MPTQPPGFHSEAPGNMSFYGLPSSMELCVSPFRASPAINAYRNFWSASRTISPRRHPIATSGISLIVMHVPIRYARSCKALPIAKIGSPPEAGTHAPRRCDMNAATVFMGTNNTAPDRAGCARFSLGCWFLCVVAASGCPRRGIGTAVGTVASPAPAVSMPCRLGSLRVAGGSFGCLGGAAIAVTDRGEYEC